MAAVGEAFVFPEWSNESLSILVDKQLDMNWTRDND